MNAMFEECNIYIYMSVSMIYVLVYWLVYLGSWANLSWWVEEVKEEGEEVV